MEIEADLRWASECNERPWHLGAVEYLSAWSQATLSHVQALASVLGHAKALEQLRALQRKDDQ